MSKSALLFPHFERFVAESGLDRAKGSFAAKLPRDPRKGDDAGHRHGGIRPQTSSGGLNWRAFGCRLNPLCPKQCAAR